MPPRPCEIPVELPEVMAETFAVNDRINQLILEHLDPRTWRAKPPGGKTRTIAAIFSHVHNIRRKWVRLSAPHLKLPAPLERTRCAQKQVKAALAESAARCCEMLAHPDRTKQFQRDGWARPWPVGVATLAYMISHEAHHRGQVCMLAGQLGFPLPHKIAYSLWDWDKLWKQAGFATRPR